MKKTETAEIFTGETPLVPLKAKGGGKEGLLTRFVFHPNKEFSLLTQKRQNEVVDKILSDKMRQHCAKIGWWPDKNRKPYVIERQDDGTYILMTFLKKGVVGVSFDKNGIINVNEK